MLHIKIKPGTATPEQIADVLSDLSLLYRKMGGSGVRFGIAEHSWGDPWTKGDVLNMEHDTPRNVIHFQAGERVVACKIQVDAGMPGEGQ